METGADQFAGPLVSAGVKQTYGIVGSSRTDLTNAPPCQDKVEWAKSRHEATTSFGKNFQLIRRRFATLAGIAAIPLVLPPADIAADARIVMNPRHGRLWLGTPIVDVRAAF
jgi:hypothetical protein